MAKVKLKILFQDNHGEDFKKVLSYINPDCDDDKLSELVRDLNNLTTNKVKDIHKIVEKFLSSGDEGDITDAELLEILRGDFIPAEVDDPITDADIFSDDDFKF